MKADLLVGRSSILRMCSVNIFICTVTTGETELVLIVQKSKSKWYNLPNYSLPTDQMFTSYSGNNFWFTGIMLIQSCFSHGFSN